MANPLPPDTLNEIGVLKRREIEARFLAPLIDAFPAEFGREQVVEIAKTVIARIARDQGRALGGGFNPDLKLTRPQTIMEGAPRCDFWYRLERSARPEEVPTSCS